MAAPKSTAAFEGFNEARASAGEDDNSIKDGFYRFMKASDFDPRGLSKDEAEAWMRDNLEAAADYGLNIVDVAGDKILVEVAEDPGNPHWVDWIRNSGGGDDQAVAWQDQSAEPGEDMAAPGGGGAGPMSVDQLGEGDILAQIMAALDQLQQGRNPYMQAAMENEMSAGV